MSLRTFALNSRIEPELADALDRGAHRLGRHGRKATRSDIVRLALWDWAEREGLLSHESKDEHAATA
jgi:hypothetical protein